MKPIVGLLLLSIGFAIAASRANPAASAMSPQADAELRAAIDLLKAHEINRATADWPALEEQAYALAAGAQKPADTYSTIWFLIRRMGNRHTHLIPKDMVDAAMDLSVPMKPYEKPTDRKLVGGIGLLRIPSFQGTPDADRDYVGTARAALARFGTAGICRYVIDLRQNTGGDSWAMTNALRPLLGDVGIGYWDTGYRKLIPNVVPDRPWAEHEPWPAAYDRGAPAQPRAWVAILIDDKSWSAAEFAAVAFEGRPRTRVFGEPSGGFVAGIQSYRLPDGAFLATAQDWIVDRQRREYRVAVVPDVETPRGAPTLDAAIAWLGSQRCER